MLDRVLYQCIIIRMESWRDTNYCLLETGRRGLIESVGPPMLDISSLVHIRVKQMSYNLYSVIPSLALEISRVEQ